MGTAETGLRFIDLFSGIGGFRYALESLTGSKNHAGEGNTETVPENGERLVPSQRKADRTTTRQSGRDVDSSRIYRPVNCVFSCDNNKYASAIYRYHWNDGTHYEGDIRTAIIPEHDLLCAGFPCQPFSISGKRGGFNDTRGTVFFEIARICTEKRPRYLLLENVLGLLNHDGGQTFQTILRVLTEIGYSVQWQVLNSKEFGVPQQRERVIIVGHSRTVPRPEVFPLQGTLQQPVQEPIKMTCSPTTARCLTPLERERLQSFPDGWSKYGLFNNEIKEISDRQRNKCLGNAVTVNVIKKVAKELLTN